MGGIIKSVFSIGQNKTIDFLIQQWWLAIFLAEILWLGDHYLTVVGAKLHKANVAENVVYPNGYELNPMFEKNVAQLKWFTRKHLFMLLSSVLVSVIARLILGPMVFEFIIGSYILQWLFIDLWHIQNIIYFNDAKRPNSMVGRVEISYWLLQRTTAIRYASEAILLSIVALASMRLFFWGGVAACLLKSLVTCH